MKQYPTIPKKPEGAATHFWVFDKLDGSNIRAEWSKKRGFYKLGSRKRLLGTDQGILAKAESMIHAQEPKFREIFKDHRIERAICFFEFHGPNSFAGSHQEDEEHQVTLIDVDVYKQGMIAPAKFLKMFADSDIDTATLLHYGPVDEVFRKQVQDGTLPDMTFEGVVAKAPGRKKWAKAIMFKVKNKAWIDKVKANYAESYWNALL